MSKDGVLYIVATPIGNLDDLSVRALALLKQVDMIAAEDTRHSKRLLTHFGIDTRLTAYHDYSGERQVQHLLDLLMQGQNIALISDAGTPLISDPGYRLVRRVREAGLNVVPVPGPSAPLAALCASGLPTDSFAFVGFSPAKSAARKQFFSLHAASEHTLVCFESPHRIVASIDDAIEVLGAKRQAVLARELTKTFETFIGFSLGDIQQALADDANQSRGEMVLMIAPEPKPESSQLDAEAERLLGLLVNELPTKKAAALVSEFSGVSKKLLYQRALELKA
ncbi:16S rRNA (cytidine(1402)-2'-O)-methyltransferase [Agaribacterium haliotis]|uniref:16S rRNA (cytidine(1402)-2'-O)-methyltransferase n=1 Tax=Agaribacterium haliotis TaxID=2013869 RepID=UPI000BB5957F|nr:16S rRNA (cytidine(1402)-2'-O)-methyltransferase [Agaribacterium haliotis]